MAYNNYAGWTITGKKSQNDILGRYGPKTGGTAPAGGFPLDPTYGQIPGARGAVGSAGIPGLEDPAVQPAPRAPGGFLGLGTMNSAPPLDEQTNPSPVPNVGSPVVQPSQNAMQRQQEEAQQQGGDGGMRKVSPARRFFWSTGLIDGSAPLSPRSAPTDFDATFGAGAPHMGKPSVTWAERQAQNQQKIADVKEQRGLDSWKPY